LVVVVPSYVRIFFLALFGADVEKAMRSSINGHNII
jgi:hypothetical protein